MRIKALLLLPALLAALPSLAQDFEYTYEGQTLTYTVIDETAKTVAVGSNQSVSGNLTLPEHPVDGTTRYTLTEIGEWAFSDCSGLTQVTIPESVTEISEYAFYQCSGLTSMTIGKSVQTIGYEAFYGCDNLKSLYYNAEDLIVSEDSYRSPFPSSVETLVIGDGVKKLPRYIFKGLNAVTSLTIPSSVIEISNEAFADCTSIKELYYNAENMNTSSDIFPSSIETLEIGYGVKKLPKRIFSGLGALTSVTIPGTVTEIGDYAFAYSGLTSVTIPASVTKIGVTPFYDCSKLTSIEVGSQNSNYSSIDGVLFNKDATVLLEFPCGKTGDYEIPGTVTEISEISFEDCSNITSVIIPNSVTEIGYSAFYGCTGLTSLTIGNSVASIGEYAFSMCSALTSVVIPSSVTSLGKEVFSDCSNLTSVSLPNSITEIPEKAFEDCRSLPSVEIPESVTKICRRAFHDCDVLASIAIPTSVTEIEDDAFSRSGLTSVYSYSTVPPTLGEEVFDEVNNTIPVYVPAGAVDAYRNAEGWNYFTDFREMGGEVVELSVALSETAIELKEGETATLTATVTKPEDMAVTAEEWTSSDEAVATVDNGTVTAVAEGKTTITYTATFSNGETRTATCEVTVIKLSGIEAISAEAEGDAEYFTLQGIRVEADKLAPGVYIRRIDNRTDKILVK